jgi:hypothetical protein
MDLLEMFEDDILGRRFPDTPQYISDTHHNLRFVMV